MKSQLPVMMYIHGFRSGTNGSKREQLQEHFEGCYRVIAPEVDAGPVKSLATLNEILLFDDVPNAIEPILYHTDGKPTQCREK